MPTTLNRSSKIFRHKLALASAQVSARGFNDVAIITAGVEALGHGVNVDEKTVSGLFDILNGQKRPSYLTHDGVDYGEDRLGEEIGTFSAFRIEGPKLKADFSFLKSFIKNDADEYEKLVELANEIPDQFGLSVVCECDCVWVCDDGSEVSCMYPRPENCSADMPVLRFTSCESIDFVKNPAANPDGLFSRKVDDSATGMAETITAKQHTEALAAKDSEISALAAANKAALEKLVAEHTAALSAKDEAHKTALAAKDKEIADAKIASDAALAALNAKYEEAKKFDVRLSGAPEAVALAKKLGGDPNAQVITLPEPAESDQERWVQFSELQAKNPEAATEFRAKYLGAKRVK